MDRRVAAEGTEEPAALEPISVKGTATGAAGFLIPGGGAVEIGGVEVDGSGTRWRVLGFTPSSKTWRGRAVIDGQIVTRDLGTVKGRASEPAPLYEIGEEVSVEGLPAVVLDRWGAGLEVSPGDPSRVLYAVRIRRPVQKFGSQPDDVRQCHAWAIDP